jgi:hypothetical protein
VGGTLPSVGMLALCGPQHGPPLTSVMSYLDLAVSMQSTLCDCSCCHGCGCACRLVVVLVMIAAVVAILVNVQVGWVKGWSVSHGMQSSHLIIMNDGARQ